MLFDANITLLVTASNWSYVLNITCNCIKLVLCIKQISYTEVSKWRFPYHKCLNEVSKQCLKVKIQFTFDKTTVPFSTLGFHTVHAY